MLLAGRLIEGKRTASAAASCATRWTALQFPAMGRSRVGPGKHCPLVGWLSPGRPLKAARLLRTGELKPSRGSEISHFIFLAGTEFAGVG